MDWGKEVCVNNICLSLFHVKLCKLFLQILTLHLDSCMLSGNLQEQLNDDIVIVVYNVYLMILKQITEIYSKLSGKSLVHPIQQGKRALNLLW